MLEAVLLGGWFGVLVGGKRASFSVHGASVPASLERGLLQDRLEGWLYVFRDVLDEERPSDPDAVLQRPQQLSVRHGRYLFVLGRAMWR